MAAERPASARLGAVAAAGRSTASYTTLRDTTRAQAHLAVGDHRAAHDDYTRVIELKPDIFGPWIARAEIRLALGRFGDALQDAEQAKELNWFEPEPFFDLLIAECHLKLGNAVAAARNHLAALPKHLNPEASACRRELLSECDVLSAPDDKRA